MINVEKIDCKILVKFLYNKEYVEKIKTIERHRWHIQEFLWYKNSKTTEIYTHVSQQDIGQIKSYLDFEKNDDKKLQFEISHRVVHKRSTSQNMLFLGIDEIVRI